MSVSTLATFVLLLVLLSGCQLPYLMSGAWEQVRILRSRQPIEKVLQKGVLNKEEADKLKFAQKASLFAEDIGLNCKKNFKTYVQLKRPYVSYVVIASEKKQLKLKKWSFPIVGEFPYLGFFSEKEAKKLQQKLIKKDYDTYLRGASAYSSLGWFKEPILSSMLRGSQESLAETIFHECFHGTFFFKNRVELNERLAVFIGYKALLEFLKKENSPSVDTEQKAWQDQQLFTDFLKKSLHEAEEFYASPEVLNRSQLFEAIRSNYQAQLKPQLSVLSYERVFDQNINNAKLLAFKTYFHDFSKLEELFDQKFSQDIKKMILYFRKLEPLSKKAKTQELLEIGVLKSS